MNLDPATKAIIQKHFTTMWKGLEAQGWERALVSSSGHCTYHDPITGYRCAVGHCLPEPEQMQGSVRKLIRLKPRYKEVLGIKGSAITCQDDPVFRFLFAAQGEHDRRGTPEMRKARFVELAATYGVEVPQ